MYSSFKMTENQACEFAEKKEVIREVSPVKLSSDTDLSCLQGNSVNEHIGFPNPKVVVQIYLPLPFLYHQLVKKKL